MGTHGRRGERVTRSAPHTHPRSRKAGEAPLTLGGVGRRVERQVERRLERLIERLVEHVQRRLVRASTLTSHGPIFESDKIAHETVSCQQWWRRGACGGGCRRLCVVVEGRGLARFGLGMSSWRGLPLWPPPPAACEGCGEPNFAFVQ